MHVIYNSFTLYKHVTPLLLYFLQGNTLKLNCVAPELMRCQIAKELVVRQGKALYTLPPSLHSSLSNALFSSHFLPLLFFHRTQRALFCSYK